MVAEFAVKKVRIESQDKALMPKQDQALKPLTKAQEALLEQLRDPTCVSLTVEKICKLANITRATYYTCFKDENFLKVLEAETQAVLAASELPVIHNVVGKAKSKEEKSHHWAAMILKMRGRLEEQGRKPAQVVVNFGNVKRPKVKISGTVIEAEAEEVDNA